MDDYACEVRSDWTDYNGHMSDAYYALVFSHALDAMMEHIGLDAAGRARQGSSLFTAETHIRYLREVRGGGQLRVVTQLLSHDAKRLRIAQSMFVPDSVEPVATAEQLLLHVDMNVRRVAPFPAAVLARVQALPRP